VASSNKAIYAAIAGNGLIAVTKFIGAAISGSSAMIAEGIHSVVDTGNGGLLLLGKSRSQLPPDKKHPFGYGKELYFYTLIVAVLIFGVGGGVSIYEGILHTMHPGEIKEAGYSFFGFTFGGLTLNLVVLGLAMIFEGYALTVAWNEFKKVRGDTPVWEAVRTGKDPTAFMVLFEDAAAEAGLIVAAIGISLAHWLEMPVLDGIASIGIGVILCIVASFLVWESRGLLLGESAAPAVTDSIREIARADDAVQKVRRALTMHMGPQDVILNLDLTFFEDLSAEEVEEAVDRMERNVREKHAEVNHIFIEAESLAGRKRPA
jgi:cation diffusion facilitator family transporter